MTNDRNTVPIRGLCLEALLLILEENRTSSEVLGNILMKHEYLPKQERAFLSRLVSGTIERKIELDYIINQFSKVKTKKMKPVIRNILRMGVYQLKYMSNVPESAACNESVKLAQKKGFHNLKGFVNGVLRNVSRNLDDISYPSKEKDAVSYYSVKYSMPEWLVKKWIGLMDEQTVESMFEAFAKEKDTTIRVNVSKIDINSFKNELETKEIVVKPGNYVSDALHISKYNYMSMVPGFEEGYFNVQDESSMLSVFCADIKEGMDVMDVCAAPGGKTMLAASKLKESGSLISCDVSELKTAKIEQNLERMKLKNVNVEVWDATNLREEWIESKDVVLADVPCSGLGVIGKKPDIKYNCTEEGINTLIEIQRAILSVASKYVRKNGVLLFSTCTINEAENEENMRWFQENFDFTLESITPYLPESLHGRTTDEGYLQLIPGVHKTDGFFMARFRKNESC